MKKIATSGHDVPSNLEELGGAMRTSTFLLYVLTVPAFAGCKIHSTGGGTGGQGGASQPASASSGSGGGGAASGSSSAGGAGAGGAGGGDLVWAKAYPGCAVAPGSGPEGAPLNSLVTDPSGQITIGGAVPVQCTMNFGPLAVKGGNGFCCSKGYLASFDAAGSPLWARDDITPDFNNHPGVAIAYDTNGQSRIAAVAKQYKLAAEPSYRVLILASNGSTLVDKELQQGQSPVGGVPELDGAGDIFLSCYQNWFSGGCGHDVGPTGEYLVKFDPAGQYLWSKPIPISVVSGAKMVTPSGYAFADQGAAGASFDCGPATEHAAKLDPSGTCVWARSFPGAVPSLWAGVNATGETLFAGLLTGPMAMVDFGCGPLQNTSFTTFVVAKLDPSGSCVFSRSFTGPGFNMPATNLRTVRSTGVNDWLLALTFDGTIDFGGGPVTSTAPSGQGAIFVKLDASGSFRWNHYWPDGEKARISGDAAGGMVLGSSSPTIDLGTGPLLNNNPGIVLARFAP